MHIQSVDLGGSLSELYDTYAAATADFPGPLMSRKLYEWLLRVGGSGARTEAWAAVEDGKVVGCFGLIFPQLDNTHLANVFALAVQPEHRRRGVGSALLAHAGDRARADNRRLLIGEAPAEGTGAALSAARGFTVSLREARRTLDLRTADWDALRAMSPQVDGYRLERFSGPAPEDLLADLATLMGGMNDAPQGEDIQDMHFDAERMRVMEAGVVTSGSHCYTTIARRTSDGAPAGYTRIYLEADRSDGWGRQGDTTVLAEHRGHRLGLLLKVSNTVWLHESEPHLDQIVTWNATSNAHMLAINEAMGFTLLDEWNIWQLPL